MTDEKKTGVSTPQRPTASFDKNQVGASMRVPKGKNLNLDKEDLQRIRDTAPLAAMQNAASLENLHKTDHKPDRKKQNEYNTLDKKTPKLEALSELVKKGKETRKKKSYNSFISFRVTDETKLALDAYSVATGVQVSNIVRDVFEQFVASDEVKKKIEALLKT